MSVWGLVGFIIGILLLQAVRHCERKRIRQEEIRQRVENDLNAALRKMREEAGMNNLKAAIDGLEALKTHYDIQGPGAEAGTVYHLFVASIDTALAALRDAQARQEGCEWCNEENLDLEYYYTLPTAPRMFQTRRSYCHKCGRALNEPDGNADKLATVSKTESVGQGPEPGGEGKEK